MMKQFRLTFANVGYGEAMLFEIPDPSSARGVFVVLFDGGPGDPNEFIDSASGRKPFVQHLNALGIDHIDAMIVSHIHEDHVSGLLPVARKIPPKALISSFSPAFWKSAHPLSSEAGETVSLQKFTQSLNDFRALCELTEQNGGTVRQAVAGDTIPFPNGLIAKVLAPEKKRASELEEALLDLYATANDAVPDQHKLRALDGSMNNYSVMLRFAFGKTRLLLPGDTNRLGFDGIDPNELSADLYKVGHHGQIDGADEALLQAIQPKAVVCCASSDRRYNSAHPDLLRAIAASGAMLYCSDCPPNPVGDPIPAHHLLRFTIDDAHGITPQYI